MALTVPFEGMPGRREPIVPAQLCIALAFWPVFQRNEASHEHIEPVCE